MPRPIRPLPADEGILGDKRRGLTIGRYEKMAMRTKSETSDLVTAALGLNGESGEFADLIKKVRDHGHAFDRNAAIKELGDIGWYLALACDQLDIPLATVLRRNLIKLKNRYPEKFATKLSQTKDESKE